METVYRDYLSALLAGDRTQCSRIVKEQIDRALSIQDLYEGLFKRSLYEVGALWEENRISVAVEHMATAITEGLMNGLYDRIVSARRTPRKAIVASVTDELHQVGGKMVADVFEMKGWDSYYLGADIPSGELIRLARDLAPDVVGLSMSLYFHLGSLKRMASMLRDQFPDLPIIVGGQGLRHGGGKALENQPNLAYIDSLAALERFIDAFDARRLRKGEPL
jgi:methanogenic corrinoid protein MtbC1